MENHMIDIAVQLIIRTFSGVLTKEIFEWISKQREKRTNAANKKKMLDG